MSPAHPTDDRTVPVAPTVHIETFATHATATWKAGTLDQFLRTVSGVDSVADTAPVIVDETDVGRDRRQLSALATE